MKAFSAGLATNLSSRAALGLLLALLGGISAFAQSFRGSIRGEVRDASGSVLVGATVQAMNIATGQNRAATSAADGFYVIPELPAGDYQVTAQAKDLAPVTQTVRVIVGTDTTADFVLAKVAPVGQKITVTEVTPLIETSHDVLGGVVQSQLVQELPLNGRDFGKLVAMVPGVVVEGSGVAGTEKGFGQFNINGNRDRSNNYTLDGTDNNDPWFNNSALNQVGITGAPATLLPIDAIQELNVESQFNAEYGRNSGSVVNVITKSGTNELHGSLFEYLRNSFFDARNFFNTKPVPQTGFKNNQFGGSLGGPILHDRTFFFLAYEGQRERVGSDFIFSVPTTDERNKAKAFVTSASCTLPGCPLPAVNPALDAILNFYPQSTTGKVPGTVNDKNDLDNFIIKIDHKISGIHSLSARYAFGQNEQIFPFGSFAFGGGSRLGQFAQASPTRVQVFSFSFLSAFTANRVNEFRFGYTRFRNSFRSLDDKFNPADIGLQFGTGKLGLPEMDFSGNLENLGATGFSIPRARFSQSFQVLDNFTYLSGRHAWKFGAEVRRAAVNAFNDNLERGIFSFSNNSPLIDPDPVVDILANYYVGNAFVLASAGNTQRTTYNNGLAFFAQDDFRFKPDLTFNLGLRWEYFGPISEKRNLLSNFTSGGTVLETVGSAGLDGAYTRDLNNFGPRIGLAWNPLRRTVVRAGYGIYFDYVPQHLMIANFTSSAGIATNPVGSVPVLQLAFPGGYNTGSFNGTGAGSILTFSSAGPFSIFITDHNLRTPYVQSWNVNVQQQFGQAISFEVGYVGSKGTKLVRLYDKNQNGGNPNYFSIDVLSSGTSSTYHGLQLSARLQKWHDWSGFSSYTFSKSLDGASDGIDFTTGAAFPQDSTNLKAEKGPSTFDTKHRFVTALNFQVPAWSRLPKRLAEGWQLNTVTNISSGQPIPIVICVSCVNFDQRPSIVPGVNPILPHWRPDTGYLNPAAFQNPTGSFGNLGRNQIYGPGFWNVDFSVTKTTPLRESLAMEFRMEFYNLFNHPIFALPSGSITPGVGPAGVVSQTPDVAQGNPGLGGGGPRVLQFALRLNF